VVTGETKDPTTRRVTACLSTLGAAFKMEVIAEPLHFRRWGYA
jgi:hypothetical protein